MVSNQDCSPMRAAPQTPSLKVDTIGSLFADACSRWLAFHAQARRDRRDVQILSQLDDQQLKDVGLTRGQIDAFVAERCSERARSRA